MVLTRLRFLFLSVEPEKYTLFSPSRSAIFFPQLLFSRPLLNTLIPSLQTISKTDSLLNATQHKVFFLPIRLGNRGNVPRGLSEYIPTFCKSTLTLLPLIHSFRSNNSSWNYCSKHDEQEVNWLKPEFRFPLNSRSPFSSRSPRFFWHLLTYFWSPLTSREVANWLMSFFLSCCSVA